VAKLVIRRRL